MYIAAFLILILSSTGFTSSLPPVISAVPVFLSKIADSSTLLIVPPVIVNVAFSLLFIIEELKSETSYPLETSPPSKFNVPLLFIKIFNAKSILILILSTLSVPLFSIAITPLDNIIPFVTSFESIIFNIPLFINAFSLLTLIV